MEELFKIAYFAGLLVEIVVRAPYDRQRRKIEKTDRRVTASEQAVLVWLAIGVLVLPLLYVLTSSLGIADYPLSAVAKTSLGDLGLAFLAASIWLFWRAHRDLGAYWSPSLEIGAKHQLVTQGVYRAIRHPPRRCSGASRRFCFCRTGSQARAGLVSFLLLYLVRVPREERCSTTSAMSIAPSASGPVAFFLAWAQESPVK